MRRNKIAPIAAAAAMLIAGCSTAKDSSSQSSATSDTEAPAPQTPDGANERHIVTVECVDGGKYELRTDGVKGLTFPDGASSPSIAGQSIPEDLNPILMLLDDMERSLSPMNSGDTKPNTPINTYGVYVVGDNELSLEDGVAAVGYVPLVTAEQVQEYVFSNGNTGWDLEMLLSFTQAVATVEGLDSSEVTLMPPLPESEKITLQPNKPVTAQFDLDFAYEVYGERPAQPLGKQECTFTLELGSPS